MADAEKKAEETQAGHPTGGKSSSFDFARGEDETDDDEEDSKPLMDRLPAHKADSLTPFGQKIAPVNRRNNNLTPDQLGHHRHS